MKFHNLFIVLFFISFHIWPGYFFPPARKIFNRIGQANTLTPSNHVSNIKNVADLRNLRVQTSNDLQNQKEISFVVTNNGLISVKPSSKVLPLEKVCAYGRINASIMEVGWDQLYVKTEGSCGRLGSMYAAGWVEGYLFAEKMEQYYHNYIADSSGGSPEIKKMFRTIYEDTLAKSAKEKNSKNQVERTFWNGVELFTSQFEGIVAGAFARSKGIDFEDILLINSNGELSDLVDVFGNYLRAGSGEPQIFSQQSARTFKKGSRSAKEFLAQRLTKEEADELWVKELMKSHCSAFIKLLRDRNGLVKDVLAGHGTWDSYEGMLKVMKRYHFKVKRADDDEIEDYKLIFPSYPGSITSQDDFYVRANGLVLTETTLNNYNDDEQVFDPLNYMPTFLKLATSNFLGNTAENWVKYFSLINTGTYNSQWMILDINSMIDSVGQKQLKPSSFHVLEQMPGIMIHKDVTDVLNKESYWASFNLPAFDETYENSGAKEIYEATGSTLFSRSEEPRNIIFQEMQSQVNNIEDLKRLIRLNRVNKDGNPNESEASQLASRFDLSSNPGEVQLFGETDAKVIDLNLAREPALLAISGPTTGDGDLPPFSFPDNVYKDLEGLPKTWNFSWAKYSFEI